jgi:hypothetical protein
MERSNQSKSLSFPDSAIGNPGISFRSTHWSDVVTLLLVQKSRSLDPVNFADIEKEKTMKDMPSPEITASVLDGFTARLMSPQIVAR